MYVSLVWLHVRICFIKQIPLKKKYANFLFQNRSARNEASHSERIHSILGSKTPVVALTSMLSKDTTIGPRALLKYDHVVTNWGGAYQPTTGIFTAPYDGLYSISCTMMSSSSNYVHLEMMKNGQRISIVFSNAKTYPQASQTLHLILNKGDRIWMQNHNNHNANMHDWKEYNVFSGILIKDL